MDTATREWEPGGSTITWLNLGGLALLAIGLVGYVAVWTGGSDDGDVTLSGGQVLAGIAVTVLLSLALMAAHEGIHGLTVRRFGGTPRYGATMVGKVLPAFYCTSPGTRFSRIQFLLVALAPAAILTPACAVAIALFPFGGWLVLPAAMTFAGAIGDIAMAIIVARQPPGTLVEDLKSGMRFHPPPDA